MLHKKKINLDERIVVLQDERSGISDGACRYFRAILLVKRNRSSKRIYQSKRSQTNHGLVVY